MHRLPTTTFERKVVAVAVAASVVAADADAVAAVAAATLQHIGSVEELSSGASGNTFTYVMQSQCFVCVCVLLKACVVCCVF